MFSSSHNRAYLRGCKKCAVANYVQKIGRPKNYNDEVIPLLHIINFIRENTSVKNNFEGF